MSFQIDYIGGGILDKIRSINRLESGRLDGPHMPKLVRPYIVGGILECSGDNTFIGKLKFDRPVELLLVAVDGESYHIKDSWEVIIGDTTERYIDTVTSTKYPEGLNLMVAHPIPAETEIRFLFHNYSGEDKKVWYHFQFLCEEGAIKQLPVKEDKPPRVDILAPVNPFCFQYIADGQTYKVKGIITDDMGVREYNMYIDGERKVFKDFAPPAQLAEFEIEVPIPVPPPPTKPKVDIIFIVDTSGSMGDDIANTKANLKRFKNKLKELEIDSYMGYLNSNNNDLNRQPLIPAEEFELDLELDGGTWEGMGWGQITNPEWGGFSFIPEFREGSKRYFIMLTDTHITEPYNPAISEDLKKNNITVTVIHELPDKDYDQIISDTGGLNLEIRSPDFSEQLDAIATQISKSIVYPPPVNMEVEVEAVDELGLKTKEKSTINVEWCDI